MSRFQRMLNAERNLFDHCIDNIEVIVIGEPEPILRLIEKEDAPVLIEKEKRRKREHIRSLRKIKGWRKA